MNQFNQYNNNYNRMPQFAKSSLDWIMVQSVDQVEYVAVQPMCKAWIMVQNEPIFALRQADSMGLTTTEFYRFEKYEPNPAPEYVTKAELLAMIEEMKGEKDESTTTKRGKATSQSANA